MNFKIPKNTDQNFWKFLRKYFKTIINEVKQAKESITIIDYTGDNLFVQHGEHYEYFNQAYRVFLSEIAEFIKRKKEEVTTLYRRIVRPT